MHGVFDDGGERRGEEGRKTVRREREVMRLVRGTFLPACVRACLGPIVNNCRCSTAISNLHIFSPPITNIATTQIIAIITSSPWSPLAIVHQRALSLYLHGSYKQRSDCCVWGRGWRIVSKGHEKNIGNINKKLRAPQQYYRQYFLGNDRALLFVQQLSALFPSLHVVLVDNMYPVL